MFRRSALKTTVSIALIAALPAACTHGGAPVDFASRIVNADSEPQNWLTHGRTYDESRYSPLTLINKDNVAGLGLAWHYDLDTHRGQEATPIVVDGILYVTSAWSKVHAFDAVSGKLLWQYDPQVPGETGVKACCDVVNRGVAVWNGKLFVGTLDGRLVALDAKTGKPVWSVVTVDQSKPYTITGAPRIIHGKVIIGNGGAELGVRGYVTAYDAETGKQIWRFYTVPGEPGKPDGAASDDILEKLAGKTWTGDWWKETGGGGGGTVWDSMAYDPQLNLLYLGVGNASHWAQKYRSPGGGDNLFVASIVALDPDTGKYVWHYQQTPGDEWDYTSTQSIILADLRIDGQDRKVLMQAPKNGFFYVIDRTNGKLISAEPYAKLNWAERVDRETGRPVFVPGARYSETGKPWLGQPGPYGAHGWQPMAFSHQTGLVYIPAQDAMYVYFDDPAFRHLPQGYNTGTGDLTKADDPVPTKEQVRALMKGSLLAWDPVNQKEAWRVPQSTFSNGGILTTAGSLLFQGTGDAQLTARNAFTGELLWSFDAQDTILAPPVTYSVNGKQYVSVLVGWGGAVAMAAGPFGWNVNGVRKNKSRLLTFALGAKHSLPPAKPNETIALTEPPKPFGTPEMLTTGAAIYGRTCGVCHGVGGISSGGAPDLRHSGMLLSSEAWKAVVYDGALSTNGMVGFKDNFTPEEVEAVRAYVAERANRTWEK